LLLLLLLIACPPLRSLHSTLPHLVLLLVLLLLKLLLLMLWHPSCWRPHRPQYLPCTLLSRQPPLAPSPRLLPTICTNSTLLLLLLLPLLL
jgi:hypothetical protein